MGNRSSSLSEPTEQGKNYYLKKTRRLTTTKTETLRVNSEDFQDLSSPTKLQSLFANKDETSSFRIKVSKTSLDRRPRTKSENPGDFSSNFLSNEKRLPDTKSRDESSYYSMKSKSIVPEDLTGIINKLSGEAKKSLVSPKFHPKKLPIKEEDDEIKLWRGKQRIESPLPQSHLNTKKFSISKESQIDYLKTSYFLKPSIRKSSRTSLSKIINSSCTSFSSESQPEKEKPKMNIGEKIKRLKELTGFHLNGNKRLRISHFKTERNEKKKFKSDIPSNYYSNSMKKDNLIYALFSRGFPPTFYYLHSNEMKKLLSDKFYSPLNSLSPREKLNLANLKSRRER